MPLVTLLHNTNCIINIYPEESILCTKWLSEPSPDVFKEHVRLSIEFAEKYKTRYWLSDNTAGITLTLEQQRWKAESIAACIARTNLCRIALVVPADPLYQLMSYKIVDKLRELADNSLQIEAFTEHFTAKDWLLNFEFIPM